MLETSANPPDIIIYDFDVDCFDGEKIVQSLTAAFPNAYLLFSCSFNESYLIPKFKQSCAFGGFIKDHQEMKRVEYMLENIRNEKKSAGRAIAENCFANACVKLG